MTPTDPLARLLAGTYPDPETGAPLGTNVRTVVIEDDLTGRERELVTGHAAGAFVVVLTDPDTARVLGDRVVRALTGAVPVQALQLERAPHADEATLERLAGAIDPRADVLVTVGSGTLTDLGKMTAQRRGLTHLAFATAPSMNGYTSSYASITMGGLKRSVRAAPPTALFVDLGVVAAAPARMIRSGLGDSVCRSTAQADWLLAHLLLDQPYREAPFAILAGDEPPLLAQAEALVRGDRGAVRHLVRTLVLSGFGMTLCGGSYPASQGEHLISHYMDTRRPPGVAPAPHGEQVGVATVTMAALQDRVLGSDRPPVLAPSPDRPEPLLAHFGPDLGATCWNELAPKLLDRDRAEALTARLAAVWDTLRARIAALRLGPERIRACLAAAGAPTTPAALGWSDAAYADAVRHARAIRNRYTFLDLAAATGALP